MRRNIKVGELPVGLIESLKRWHPEMRWKRVYRSKGRRRGKRMKWVLR